MKGNFTFVSVLMSLVLGVSLAACKGEPEKKQVRSDPVPVSVGKVRQIREQETITVSGSVNAPNSPANVSFLVSGKVVFSGPREGEYVRQGQVLARIDPTDYQLAVQGAEAQSAAADAVQEKTMNSARPEQLEQARITFERAEDEYRRMKMLYESKSLAPNDFLKYKAVYESAQQQYELAKAGGQKEDKEQAKAASRQAVAGLRVARKALSDTTLCAPASGYIAKRYIEVGDTASPARPAFEIVQLDPVEVTVGVPETDIHLVRIGQKAEIRIPAQPEKTFDGTLRVLNVSADPNTRTYMARIRVPNPDQLPAARDDRGSDHSRGPDRRPDDGARQCGGPGSPGRNPGIRLLPRPGTRVREAGRDRRRGRQGSRDQERTFRRRADRPCRAGEARRRPGRFSDRAGGAPMNAVRERNVP